MATGFTDKYLFNVPRPFFYDDHSSHYKSLISMARLDSNRDHTGTQPLAANVARPSLAETSGNSANAMYHDASQSCAKDEHTIARQQRSLTISTGRNRLQAPLVADPTLPQFRKPKQIARTTPGTQAKGTVKYDFNQLPPTESMEEFYSSEWSGSEEDAFSQDEEADFIWNSVRVPAKYQQDSKRTQFRSMREPKITVDIVDLTSPVKEPSTGGQMVRKLAAQLDEYRSGFTSSSDSDGDAFIKLCVYATVVHKR